MLQCRVEELTSQVSSNTDLQLENNTLSKKLVALQESNTKLKELNEQNSLLFEKMMEQESGLQDT